MWYLASQFTDESKALKPYTEIQSLLKQAHQQFSVVRLKLEGVPYVVAFSETTPTAYITIVRNILKQGTLTTLDSAIINRLMGRRNERKQGMSFDTRGMGYSELHQPVKLDEYGHGKPVEDSFETTIMQAPSDSPLKAGSKVRVSFVPFIKAYEDIHSQMNIDEFLAIAYKNNLPIDDIARDTIDAILRIEAYLLHHCEKYLFTGSAIELHQKVFSQNSYQWIQPSQNIWIEMQSPISTPYADNIKALFVHDASPMDMIHKLFSDKTLATTLRQTFEIYQHQWSIDVIDKEGTLIFDLTYDKELQTWVFHGSHVCPYHQCQYKNVSIQDIEKAQCIPCEKCKKAVEYWFTWVHTAMKIINREYALNPLESEAPYATHSMTYQEDVKKSVGKGKNRREIASTVTKSVDYRLITFEVGTLKVGALKPDEGTKPKRSNWLTLADKTTVIWEYKEIDTSKGRVLNPEKNSRWKRYQHIPVTRYKRWVAMLEPSEKRIVLKKVVVSLKELQHDSQ